MTTKKAKETEGTAHTALDPGPDRVVDIRVSGDLAARDAVRAHNTVRAAIADLRSKGGKARIVIDGPLKSLFAVQLAVSASRSLTEDGSLTAELPETLKTFPL